MNLKKIIIIIAKFIVAILGILAVFFYGKISISDFISQISSIRPGFYIISLVIVTLIIVFVTRRWKILIAENEEKASFMSLVNINFIGCFFNLILPSSFGGDLVRAVYLKNKINSWEISASSVFLDRFLGLMSLFFLAFISLLIKILFEKSGNTAIIKYLITGTITLFIGWIILINLHRIIRKIFSLKNQRINKYIEKYELFSKSINLANYPKGIIIKGFVISVIGNLLSAISIYFITLALNLQVGIFAILIIFPLVTVISMIPVSVGGIGLREGAFVFFLAGYSVSSANSLAVSILYFSTLIFLGIIGGIIFSLSKYTLSKINILRNSSISDPVD